MDGSLTTHFFSHIKERISDYKICVDQGFPRSEDATGFLVGPIPERSARQLHPLVRDNLISLSNVYTSLRKASKWGMRGLQGTFPRCKKCLPLNKDKHRRVLECIILVHNIQTEVVGHNQISAVFVPEYKRVINILTYMVTIGFAYITLSLAITRLTTKQSCWRKTLATTEKMKMDVNVWGQVT